jgi:hypothetical protein
LKRWRERAAPTIPLELVAALCSLGDWLEDECGLFQEFIGREGLAPRYGFKLTMSGRHLHYEVRFLELDAFGLYVSAMDRADKPLSVVFMATASNFQRVRAIISALESTGVRSLSPRPIELGKILSPGSVVIA